MVLAADQLIGFQSARIMSEAMPWIANNVSLFRKYDLDFQLVCIPSLPLSTAATVGAATMTGPPGGSRATAADTLWRGDPDRAPFGVERVSAGVR